MLWLMNRFYFVYVSKACTFRYVNTIINAPAKLEHTNIPIRAVADFGLSTVKTDVEGGLRFRLVHMCNDIFWYCDYDIPLK